MENPDLGKVFHAPSILMLPPEYKYEQAGASHTGDDVPVGWDDLQQAQNEINGHVAMMIKIFKIGSNWNHQDRIRETMINDSLTVCPVSLLMKDHKKWDRKSNKPPPTRHVAGGHVGMNLHMSEILSDILEPIVENIPGGEEVISTEDFLARIDELNLKFKGWNKHSWWENKLEGEFQCCGKCDGDELRPFNIDDPEWCSCTEVKVVKSDAEDTVVKMMNKLKLGGTADGVNQFETQLQQLSCKEVDGGGEVGMTSEGGDTKANSVGVEIDEEVSVTTENKTQSDLGEDSYCHVPSDGHNKKKTVTVAFMKKLRRRRWEEEVGWEPEQEDRIFLSNEVLPEELQDYTCPMAVIGNDVVSLYPNLDVKQVAKNMK